MKHLYNSSGPRALLPLQEGYKKKTNHGIRCQREQAPESFPAAPGTSLGPSVVGAVHEHTWIFQDICTPGVPDPGLKGWLPWTSRGEVVTFDSVLTPTLRAGLQSFLLENMNNMIT